MKGIIPPGFSWKRCIAANLLLCSLGISTVYANTPDLQFIEVSSQDNVVDITHADDGSGRLFLVERHGRIWIVQNGETLQAPFLDIRNRVGSAGREQGLLSLAFAPDYMSSRYFYVWYTNAGGDTELARYRVGANANEADPNSHQLVLAVAQPRSNHNGGRLRFGPDGMLYLSLGDGGGANDPDGNAQKTDTLLGKLIRIDVNPALGSYAVPDDNPFVNDDSTLGEIWANGLRNPWRISFDRKTGKLFIADVGQNALEEINMQPAESKGGENYGWNDMEGSGCLGGGGCDRRDKVLPVFEYPHDNGNCSITGGEVYRGSAYPNLYGLYLYADYCTGRLWGLNVDSGQWENTLLRDTPWNILTFGEGEDGSLYVADSEAVMLIGDGEVVPEGVRINAGMNDVWINTDTGGQGMMIAVFEETGVIFVAWFTFDVERPPQDASAILGESGHRWLTAQGTMQGDTATLDIYQTTGGVFDAANPPVNPAVKIGTMTIRWTGCNSAVLSYDIPSLGLMNEFEIERVVLDNVALCKALQ